MRPVVLVTSSSRELAEPVVKAFAGQIKFVQTAPPPIPFCARVSEIPPHLCQIGDRSHTSAPLIDLSLTDTDTAIENIKQLVSSLVKGPSIFQMGRSALGDLMKWSAVKFGRCSDQQIQARLDECKTCPYWEPEAFNNTGRCKKCGCSTWAKLKLKSSSCPDGRWTEIRVEPDNITDKLEPELQ